MTFSFVLKIWVEAGARDVRERRWRGQITHVPSGHQLYVRSMVEVGDFVDDHLEQAGIRRNGWRRLRRRFWGLVWARRRSRP